MLIKCPACSVETGEFIKSCPACGFSVPIIDGFEAWAPELAKSCSGDFFDPEKFKELAASRRCKFLVSGA